MGFKSGAEEGGRWERRTNLGGEKIQHNISEREVSTPKEEAENLYSQNGLRNAESWVLVHHHVIAHTAPGHVGKSREKTSVASIQTLVSKSWDQREESRGERGEAIYENS